MNTPLITRRSLLATSGAALVTGTSGLLAPAQAAGLAPTPTMRGGSNNYRPDAPIVELQPDGAHSRPATFDLAEFGR